MFCEGFKSYRIFLNEKRKSIIVFLHVQQILKKLKNYLKVHKNEYFLAPISFVLFQG
jgi:hypothetical protein